MPFYEYECGACGAQTEVLQKISDKPLRKCPECGKSALVKLISAPIFRLKGSGWYETDFKSEQDRKRNLAGEGEDKDKKPDAKDGGESKSAATEDSAAAPKAEAKADTKADNKAESKAESKAEAKAKPARSTKPSVSAKSSSGTKPARRSTPRKAK